METTLETKQVAAFCKVVQTDVDANFVEKDLHDSELEDNQIETWPAVDKIRILTDASALAKKF